MQDSWWYLIFEFFSSALDFFSLILGGPAGLDKVLPGVLGSLGALFWIEGTWARKVGMFALGSVLSIYGGPWISSTTGLAEGFAGFLVGLFGMQFVDKVFESWSELKLVVLIHEAVRKRLGLPPRE